METRHASLMFKVHVATMMNAIGRWPVVAAGIAVAAMGALAPVIITNPGGEPVARAQAEFRNDGERVFRLQNSVLDELINAITVNSGLPAQDEEDLLAAEDGIVDNCRDLNHAAILATEGKEPGIRLQLRVMYSMTRCEESAEAARSLLAGRTGLSSADLP